MEHTDRYIYSPLSLKIARNSEAVTKGEKHSADPYVYSGHNAGNGSNNCLKRLCYLVPNKNRKYSDLTKLFAVYLYRVPNKVS